LSCGETYSAINKKRREMGMTGLREGICWIKLGMGFIIAFLGASLIGFGQVTETNDYYEVTRVIYDLTPIGALLVGVGSAFLLFGMAPYIVDLIRKAKCDLAKNTDPDAD